jgi:hypothetical protein
MALATSSHESSALKNHVYAKVMTNQALYYEYVERR